jgi:hypothetical protein
MIGQSSIVRMLVAVRPTHMQVISVGRKGKKQIREAKQEIDALECKIRFVDLKTTYPDEAMRSSRSGCAGLSRLARYGCKPKAGPATTLMSCMTTDNRLWGDAVPVVMQRGK